MRKSGLTSLILGGVWKTFMVPERPISRNPRRVSEESTKACERPGAFRGKADQVLAGTEPVVDTQQ